MHRIRLIYGAALFLLFATLPFLHSWYVGHDDTESLLSSENRPAPLDESIQKDVRLVFFGSPACAASTADRTAEVVGELKRTLNSELNDDEYTVSALGVSIESDVDKGYTFLPSFKVFDELITGNGWLNSGAVEYFWRQELTEPAVPQVLVLYREVQREGRFINVSEDSLLFKSLGIDELRRRLDSGQPFVGQ